MAGGRSFYRSQMVTLASGAIAYVATNPQELARAAAVSPARAIAPTAQTSSAASHPDQPVTSPSTPSMRLEVFQFPSGTSETEARQLVAELLTERARERKDVWSRAKHPAHSPRSRSYLSQTTIR